MKTTRLIAAAVILIALLALVAAPGQAEAQCAMCRKALSDGEAGPLISALRSGIGFLLAVPLATFGAIAWLAVRGQRRLVEASDLPDDRQ